MSSPLAPFKNALASGAVAALGLEPELASTLERQIRVPEAEHGDLALPCFELAKRAQQNPPNAARQVASALQGRPPFSRVEAAGPYVNVTIDAGALAKAIVPLARSAAYGSGDAGAGKTVVIDFSSPNIAKPLAFHHIRSTVIGAAIGRLHEKLGWKVVGINYLGDWGKQFGLLATGFSRYGDPALRADAKHLVEVYVKANREADVEGKKSAIAAPDEARKLAAEVSAARAGLAAAGADPKAQKAAEKKLKTLEKRLRTLRRIDEQADPLEALDAWYAELEAARATAEAELPAAEARDREARLFFKRLEDGDPAATAEWREFRDASIAEFERIYARMGIEFQSIEGESFYRGEALDAAVQRVAEKPGVKESDGALVVDLPYKEGEPPVLLKTRDGTTLYVARDIAAAMDRHRRFEFERSLYVVAYDQSLHFSQLIRTLGAMGFDWASNMAHVPFGRVHGMSTRRGSVVFLDEVLDEAVAKAKERCEASDRIDRSLLDQTIEAIGVGAVIFGDLKNLRMSDYTFKLDDVVNFEGFTGPYVQYTHARACSILRKAGGAPAEAELGLLTLDEERAVLLALARIPDAIAEACDQYEPSILTRAVLDLSQAIASYYTAGNKERDKRVLVEDRPEVRAARLALIDGVRSALAVGLGLLGLRAPEAM